MNFLSPDDIFSGVRRKSLCNGSLLQLTSNKNSNHHNSGDNNSLNVSPSKGQSKKERRRGSFNEATSHTNGGSNAANGTGGVRRASLVSRWFKHISDAAEQYKPRSKNANHEPVDDPAIATLPHSNTKESLELTPERPTPASATATVTTTPLAPMMPIATATSVNVNNNNNNNEHNNVQLRNGRRESTPTAGSGEHKMRLSHNELSPSIGSSTAALSSASTASLNSTSAVNRTMSTRSCGEPNNNNDGYENASVTLRHTQSARQASNGHSASGVGADEFGSNVSSAGMGSGSKRDSASIVYSNNSNNTRTLMQSSPPLVEPTAIQISISPAHTAEPVLTPAERLRRLDASIREGLLEKQKIICDMFRLPVEHFHEIVDIAAMPEAPKDSADIALAAYAQVQSLTEVLNDYMHVTHEQEISAVSTAVCDQCHEKQQQQQQQQHQHSHGALTPLTGASSNSSSTSTMNSSGSSTTTQIATNASNEPAADIPPPLPPPNRQVAQQQTPPTAKTPTSTRTVLQTALLDADIHEDDDGYCEIDELRLPALPPALASKAAAASKTSSPPPPLPPPAGSMKAPPLPPPPASAATNHQQQKQTQRQEEKNDTKVETTSTTQPAEDTTSTVVQASIAELVKRQSTISADSIPEESADEVTQALNDDKISEGKVMSDPKEDVPSKDEAAYIKGHNVEHTQKGFEEVELEKLEVNEQPASDVGKKESEENKGSEPATNANTAIAATDLSELVAKAASNAEPQNEQSVSKITEEAVETSTAVNVTTMSDKIDTTAKSTVAATTTSADDDNEDDEHMDVNDAYEALSSLSTKMQNALAMVDSSTQTSPMTLSLTNAANLSTTINPPPTTCGPNRIQHANSLEPSVPCHALNTIVSSLNSQISLLLPKINERDMERERLRKENQHLRELLNAMHERQRVEAKLETPISAVGDNALTADETDGRSNTSIPNTNINSSNSPAAVAATVDNTTLDTTTTKPTVSNTTTADQPSTPTIKIETTPAIITTTNKSEN